MKKPSPPPPQRPALFVLTRSGPPVVFALALTAQLAGLALILDGHAEGAWLPVLSVLALALSVVAAAIALVSVNHSREQAAHTQSLLDEAIEALPASVEIFDADDRIVAFNQRLVDIYPHMLPHFKVHATFEELVRVSLAWGGVPDAVGREEEWLAERLTTHRAERSRHKEPLLQRVHDDRWLRIYERPMPSGGVIGVRLDVTDMIREQQRLATSQAHLQALISAAQTGVLTLDTEGHVLELNPACEALFGYNMVELQGSHIELLFGAGHATNADAARLVPTALVGAPREVSARHRNGQELTLQLNVAEVKTETTHLFVCIITDMTERKQQEMRLRQANELLARQSTTDGLTGVGNRRLFDQTLQLEWQRSARSAKPLALLMVDIDHFKQYNDHYGHVAGDDCLRRVAQVLRQCAGRSGETVCRYGGEEFTLLLMDTDAAGARVVAQRCIDSMRAAAIQHAGSPLHGRLSLSIGVAVLIGDASVQAVTLIQAADVALYQAKQAGRARFVLTDNERIAYD